MRVLTHLFFFCCWLGTYHTEEIQLALSKGYVVTRCFELYNWPADRQKCYNRQTGEHGVFSEFVDMFVKMKQMASGWPTDVVQGM